MLTPTRAHESRRGDRPSGPMGPGRVGPVVLASGLHIDCEREAVGNMQRARDVCTHTVRASIYGVFMIITFQLVFTTAIDDLMDLAFHALHAFPFVQHCNTFSAMFQGRGSHVLRVSSPHSDMSKGPLACVVHGIWGALWT